jgi:hypothetical protein
VLVECRISSLPGLPLFWVERDLHGDSGTIERTVKETVIKILLSGNSSAGAGPTSPRRFGIPVEADHRRTALPVGKRILMKKGYLLDCCLPPSLSCSVLHILRVKVKRQSDLQVMAEAGRLRIREEQARLESRVVRRCGVWPLTPAFPAYL